MAKQIKRRLNNEIEIFDLGGGYGVPTVKVLTVREVALYKLFDIPPRPPRPTDCRRPSAKSSPTHCAGVAGPTA